MGFVNAIYPALTWTLRWIIFPPVMTGSAWTQQEEAFATALADGLTEAESAQAAGCTPEAALQLLSDAAFRTHLDALTLGRCQAARAEALRFARRKMREAMNTPSKKDPLDWVKLVWKLSNDTAADIPPPPPTREPFLISPATELPLPACASGASAGEGPGVGSKPGSP